jgi:hypothetical protein
MSGVHVIWPCSWLNREQPACELSDLSDLEKAEPRDFLTTGQTIVVNRERLHLQHNHPISSLSRFFSPLSTYLQLHQQSHTALRHLCSTDCPSS